MRFLRYTAWMVIVLGSAAGGTFTESIRDGNLLLNLRFRLEYVEQEPLDKDGVAVTLRTGLGYQSGAFQGFQFLVEAENITDFGLDPYDNTKNGRTERPVVADPEDTEINRLQLCYTLGDRHKLVLGRQRIIFENARFIGNVGWRQNEQTFDAARYQGFLGPAEVNLVYLNNVNRIFGEHHPRLSDSRLDGYLVHVAFTPLPGLKLVGFSYHLDFLNGAAAHRVSGLSAKGQWPPKAERALIYETSYARQDDIHSGDDLFDTDYKWLSLGGKWNRVTATAALEILGGDGRTGFATPLATGHAFNGWADVFLTTPAAGLRDLMCEAGYKAEGWRMVGVYHRFEADFGGGNYGDELDLSYTQGLSPRAQVGAKAAVYNADTFGSDRKKFWAWLQYAW